MTFKSRKNKSTAEKPAVNTGNDAFDNGRLNAKGLNDKPEKPARASFMAGLGDVVDGFGKNLLSPDAGMIIGYLGAGGCLTVSIMGYSSLFGLWPLVAAPIALASQMVQMLPRLPKYFPEQADKLALKLGMTRYLDPKEHKDSPDLLGEVKEWARSADKRRQTAMETASAILYLCEFVGGARAFQVVNPVTMALDPAAVFLLLVGSIGFEVCMVFSEWMKSMRLTSRQSRKYNEMKRKQQIEAEQSFNN
jgi:hypothetical protein